MITAAPTLAVADVTVGTSLAGGAPLLAVDELRVTWGRASVLEQPQAATAGLVVLDRSPGATFARRTDLIGRIITLGWAGSDGSSGVNFRGRITDVAVTPLPGAVAGRGLRVALSASSVEVNLANYTVPEGTVWPAETFAARRDRIAALIPAGTVTGGVVLPTRLDLGLQASAVPADDLSTYGAAQTDVGGAGALDLLRGLFASTSPLPMVYDPAADRIRFAPRRRFGYSPLGLTISARLLASPDHAGRYVAASLTGQHLDGGALAYSGPLTQPFDSRLTRVEVSWLNNTVNYGAGTQYFPLEPTIGRRTLSLQTIHATDKATQLATLYADVASREGAVPRLGPIGYSTAREPLHDAAHAAALLAGAEGPAVFAIASSWLPQVSARPLVGVLGATVRYGGGHWSVDLNPAPVNVDPEAFTWGPVTVAASAAPTVLLRDIDPSVTVGDFGFIDVGAGIAPGDATPYKGNPLP